MNPVEAVVTFTYEYEAKFGYQYYADAYAEEVAPFFLEICELFCSDEDAEELEVLREIYNRHEYLVDELQDFLYIDQDENVLREFAGFQYAFFTYYHNFGFRAVGRMSIDDLLSRCAKLGISIEDLHSRFDVAIGIKDPQFIDQIYKLIGDPKQLLLPKASWEVKFGATKEFEEYDIVSSESGYYSTEKENIDEMDPETLGFIRENKEPLPEDMVFVKGGEFVMGRRNDLSEYRHTVQLNDFYISRYPVTFEQYDQFCKETGREKPKDGGWGRYNLPVINVSYAGAKDYCLWMTKKTGIRTDLPTEAQWEFSARGGTLSKGYKYSGGNDFDEIGWFYQRETDTNFPVGLKKPNELGIHDMSGNTWEWCRDLFKIHFYRMSNPVDPVCNTLDFYDASERRNYLIQDFFKASLDRKESELSAALKSWVTSTKEERLKQEDLEMVIRGGCEILAPYAPLPLTTRWRCHFLEKDRKVGFRIVMYP